MTNIPKFFVWVLTVQISEKGQVTRSHTHDYIQKHKTIHVRSIFRYRYRINEIFFMGWQISVYMPKASKKIPKIRDLETCTMQVSKGKKQPKVLSSNATCDSSQGTVVCIS